MWLAQKAADLIADDADCHHQQMQDNEQSQEEPSLISEISKLGVDFIAESGTFLADMNETVFNGVVGEILAPTANSLPGIGLTIGILSSRRPERVQDIVCITEYFAKVGFDVLTTGPSGFCGAACEAFAQSSDHRGRSIGVFPKSLRAKRKSETTGIPTLVDIQIFVSEIDRLTTTVNSVDAIVICPGDDGCINWNQLRATIDDTPCVVLGSKTQQEAPTFGSYSCVDSAEGVARFVMSHLCEYSHCKSSSPTACMIAEAIAKPTQNQHSDGGMKSVRGDSNVDDADADDDIDTFELI